MNPLFDQTKTVGVCRPFFAPNAPKNKAESRFPRERGVKGCGRPVAVSANCRHTGYMILCKVPMIFFIFDSCILTNILQENTVITSL